MRCRAPRGSDGLGSLRAYHAALLAFVAASRRRHVGGASICSSCASCRADELGADTMARMSRHAGARRRRREPTQIASPRAAVAAAERTDDLNLQGAMRLTLARVTDDPDEAETARRLFEAKGNVAATAAIGLSSYRP